MNDRRVLIAVPALNEAASLAGVLQEIRQAVPDAAVVVVDDGSSDRTAEIARRAGVVTLQMPFNVGVGGAMRVAFRYALDNGYRAVVQVDGDGQHDPADVETLLNALGDASVVVGSRFAGPEGAQWVGPHRRWAMRFLAVVVSRVTGNRLDDVTSGFRAADHKAIALFAEHYPTEYLGDTVESLVLTSRAGLSIAQRPVSMRPRQGGRPSQGALRSTLFLGRALMAVSVALMRRPITVG